MSDEPTFLCFYCQKVEPAMFLDYCRKCGINACCESMAGHGEVCCGIVGRPFERQAQSKMWEAIHNWHRIMVASDGAPTLGVQASVVAVEEAARLLRHAAPLEGRKPFLREHRRLRWTLAVVCYLIGAAALGWLLHKLIASVTA